jgi:hypothetical protein
VSRGLYLYGVVDSAEPLDLGNVGVGLEPARVVVIPVGDVGIAASEAEEGMPALRQADVAAHQRVLERLMRQHTVLPFRFGTVARDRPALEAFVARAGDDFREHLRRLRGRIEVGLKVFWKREAVRREVEGEVGPLPGAPGATVPHAVAIRVGQAVEQVVRRWRQRYVPEMAAALAPACEDWREGEPIGPTMLWNASFLVLRDGEEGFRERVHRLDRRLGDRLDFRYTAPLPPYSFVSLRYGAEVAEP